VRGKDFDKVVRLRSPAKAGCLDCGKYLSERVVGLPERGRYRWELRQMTWAAELCFFPARSYR
jgi:hypothetical protein